MSSVDNKMGYWRSLEEFEGAGAASDSNSEFPASADDFSDPFSRRRFMQLMGASAALAGVAGAGCRRWEKEEIVPMSERPEGYIPGNASHYATAMELGGIGHSLVITAVDGRPIKVEGNEQDKLGKGKSTAFAQGSILRLYDPDRSLNVRFRGNESTWKELETALTTQGDLRDGSGLRILSEATDSPTVSFMRQRLLQKYPRARWYEYEPLSFDNERLGLQMVFNRPLRAIHNLNRAQRLISIDGDPLVQHPAALKHAREYASKRNPDQNNNRETMMRLYAVESTFSNTGAMADHRLPLPSSEIPSFVAELEKAMDGTMPQGSDARSRFIRTLAEDLQAVSNDGRTVFIAGHRQPPAVHAAVARLNAKKNATRGRVIQYLPVPAKSSSHLDGIKSLVGEMKAGKQVRTLLILGGNPVYDAPADLDFAGALANVSNSVHLSHYYDETSAACVWHAPRTHYLESWGDSRGFDGMVYMTQPLIEPMQRPGDYESGGRSALELLSILTRGRHTPGMELVRASFDAQFSRGNDKDSAWRRALHGGRIDGTDYKAVQPGQPRPLPAPPAPPTLGRDNLEVVFTGSSHTYDGRFANNAWLQETPNFLTKLTWDNAALINPNTADELGVSHGDMIEISLGDRSIEVAAYTMPGQARYSIALALGHGRTRAGRVGGSIDDDVAPSGFDVYKLRNAAAPYIATGAKVRSAGGSYALASTQEHWKMDSVGRDGIEDRLGTLVRGGDFEQYLDYLQDYRRLGTKARVPKDPRAPNFATKMGVAAGLHEVELKPPVAGNNNSLWREHTYNRPRGQSRRPRYKWGMSIDLDKCTGCNSCTVACQAENNIPVVGKKEVMNSREMHWIRIDRYFTGDDIRDNPEIAHQPVACQQCEMAPCEQVCPVGATLHSSEGLNDMVYNRCVGTRYCANNCPFKVRRFNFGAYHTRSDSPQGSIEDARNKVRQLLFNPEVTVRSRGVMEKCTFCIQRIQNVKIAAKNEGRLLKDGEVQTACQQACPSNAIEFGNLNDRTSRVTGTHRSHRAYSLLSELNLKNRNQFLARIRNPFKPATEAKDAPNKPKQG